MAEAKKTRAKKEVSLAEQPSREIVLEGDPQAQLEFATKAAKALMAVVSQKPKKVMIRGKQFLEFSDWQTLGRFFGGTAAVDWTKPIEREGKVIGYEARALVLHKGEMISAAEAMCTIDEETWSSRDEFAIRSMAQTRASAKALRNAYGWVAELAGYASTPAEEMDGIEQDRPQASVAPPIKARATDLTSQRKQRVMVDMLKLGYDLRGMEPDDAVAAILKVTGLDMNPTNLPEIVNRLGVLVAEHEEALTVTTDHDEENLS